MRFLWGFLLNICLLSALCGDDSVSALKIAAQNNDRTALREALKAGAPLDSRYSNGWTPLHLASYRGYRQIAVILIAEGADINARDKSSASPIHYALLGHHPELVHLLIDKGADLNSGTYTGETALHYAMLPENEEFALEMISKGADCTLADHHGRIPLHSSLNPEIAAFMISKGASVNLKDKDGWTPVYNVLACGKTDMLKLLISKGAELKSSRSVIEGYSLMHIAVFAENIDNISILIENGAYISVKDKAGMTPLDYAKKRDNPEIVKLLEEAAKKEESKP